MEKIRKEKWWDLLATPQAWMLWGIKEVQTADRNRGFISPQGKFYVAELDPRAMHEFMEG